MFNNSALWWLCSLVVANMHTRNFMGAKKTFLLFFLSCSLTCTHLRRIKALFKCNNKRKRYKLMKRVSQGKLSRVAVALDAHHHQQTLNIISLKSTLYSHHHRKHQQKSNSWTTDFSCSSDSHLGCTQVVNLHVQQSYTQFSF